VAIISHISSLQVLLFNSVQAIYLDISVRNLCGPKSPQETSHSSADLMREGKVADLMNKATVKRSQYALMKLVAILNPKLSIENSHNKQVAMRDGYNCPVTEFSFVDPMSSVVPRCSRVVPISVEKKVTHCWHIIHVGHTETLSDSVVCGH
jgi:hypothetical protein